MQSDSNNVSKSLVRKAPLITREITQTVEFNCAISDARHARDYSLCIYLLRMREDYRWRKNIPLLQNMDVEQVGNWVAARESYWDEIEEEKYKKLNIGDRQFDVFEHKLINLELNKHGLVYCAGIGRMGKPHFVLSKLLSHTVKNDIQYFECGTELARDSVTVPAMAQGNHVFIRHDGVHRMLWDMFDDWCLNKNPGPRADFFHYHKFQQDASLDSTLHRATVDTLPLIFAHERGELAASKLLTGTYPELTLAAAGTRAEFYLRAARDLLADSLETWPLISLRNEIHYLDFWLANLNGVRQLLVEHSGTMTELSTGSPEERLQYLRKITTSEQQRWQHICTGLKEALEQQQISDLGRIDVQSIIESLSQKAKM